MWWRRFDRLDVATKALDQTLDERVLEYFFERQRFVFPGVFEADELEMAAAIGGDAYAVGATAPT